MTRDEINAEFGKIHQGWFLTKTFLDFAEHIVNLAAEKEREACALECERFSETIEDGNGGNYAEEIRARSEP